MPRKPAPKPPEPQHPLRDLILQAVHNAAVRDSVSPWSIGFDELTICHMLMGEHRQSPPSRLWKAYKTVAIDALTSMHRAGDLTRDPQGWYRLPPPRRRPTDDDNVDEAAPPSPNG